MKRAVLVIVLVLAFAPAGYVRREWLRPGAVPYLVEGSRDRALHGKARRRARRSAPGSTTAVSLSPAQRKVWAPSAAHTAEIPSSRGGSSPSPSTSRTASRRSGSRSAASPTWLRGLWLRRTPTASGTGER